MTFILFYKINLSISSLVILLKIHTILIKIKIEEIYQQAVSFIYISYIYFYIYLLYVLEEILALRSQ